MGKEFKILSIDGGGIRGVFPIAYLDYLSQKINGSIYEYFDLIVGTSTGGLIAIALGLDKKPCDILDLYMNKGSLIFKKGLRWYNLGLITSKYSNKDLINVLKGFFGENEILGNCKTFILIPSVDITNGKPTIFKTRHHSDYEEDFKKKVWEIGVATAAAPIFFPAFIDSHGKHLIDGGIWANNPSVIGIAEAIKLGFSLDQIKVLSLGTTSNKFHLEGAKLTKMGGLISWNTNLVEIVMQAQTMGGNSTSKYLISTNFDRIDYILPNTKKYGVFQKFGLDKCNSVKTLENFAREKAKETQKIILEKFFSEKRK